MENFTRPPSNQGKIPFARGDQSLRFVLGGAGNIRYTNQAGMEILAIQDEEEVYNQRLTNFFEDGDQWITEDMDRILLEDDLPRGIYFAS